LTLALPYLVFIISEHGLGVSGVVAAVTAGLVMSAIGQARVSPDDWRFLYEMWEQIAFWASSLIFILAALLVPRMLSGVGWHDLLLLAVLVAAALLARALVLFGLLPALTALRLSQRVDNRFKTVIVWGGLRGAVTLALALAVTENQRISPEVQRFIAVLATGFVLFTLLVNGTTLRVLIRLLGLDRLSSLDQALRDQVLALSRLRVVDSVRAIGRQYKFPDDLTEDVTRAYVEPAAGATAAGMDPKGHVIGTSVDEYQMPLGLMALGQRERELVLKHFAERTVSGHLVEELLADVGRIIDRTRASGRPGYISAAQRLADFSPRFRFAHLLHRRFGIDGPLVDCLADRFELLLVNRIVLDDLGRYVEGKLAPLLGAGVTALLEQILRQRQEMAMLALEALRAQYPDYANLQERRLLNKTALRREDSEYRTLMEEGLIGPELYGALRRDLQITRARIDLRPRLDLGLEIRALIAQVPMFVHLTHQQLDAVARLLRPRFAVPGELLIRKGDRGDSMYFISSGTVEVAAAGGKKIKLGRGDFFGEMALLSGDRRGADVGALSYCQLLVLDASRFQSLLKSDPQIKTQIDRVADARWQMNRPAGSDSAE
jgi:CPA1 family monovalent cation:H+ antiporter